MSTKSPAGKAERLDKILARLLNLSRQQAAYLIKDGRIRVNENYDVRLKGSDKVQPDDLLYLDDELIEAVSAAGRRRVLLFNKPAGCVCADKDKRYPLVHNYLSGVARREKLHSAGRLDLDACGLLILTDDGALIHQITAPKKQVSKIYRVHTDADIPAKAAESFARGVKHPEEGERYQSAELLILNPRDALVRVTEGRYHEVKRLFETAGCRVTFLQRISIGGLKLPAALKCGSFRELTEEETALLFGPPPPLTELAYNLPPAENAAELLNSAEEADVSKDEPW